MTRTRSRVMVGRDEELNVLLAAAERARAGEPTVALVTGEAGIGKSRLVSELADRLGDALVLVGHGVHLATGELPFRVLADTLVDLRRNGGGVQLAETEAVLEGLLPGANGTESSDRAGLMSAGLALFERLAADQLVCWVVEDLHWTDAATRDLINILVRSPSGRLLVVATVRTGDRDTSAEQSAELASLLDALIRLPSTELVRLSRLGREDVRRQLAGLVDEPLRPALVQSILEVGDGIPFVVEELVAARGRPGLTTAEAVAEARLGTLSGSPRRLVEAAALGDGHLQQPVVEAVLDLPAEELDEAVRAAVEAGVLEEVPAGEGFRFRHALLRAGADRAIPPAARRRWHRRWAEEIAAHPGVLAPDQSVMATAHHWFNAGEPEQAAAATVAALEAAHRVGVGQEECELWERLLDLWPKAGHLIEAAGLSHHDVLCEALVLKHGSADPNEFRALLDREAARSEDDVEIAALDWRRRLLGRAKGGEGARHLVDDAERDALVELFRRLAPDRLVIDTLAALATCFPPEDPRGEEVLEQSRTAARAIGFVRGELFTWALATFRMQARGRPDLAAEVLDGLLSDPPAAAGYDLWILDGNLVWCLAIQGRHVEAEAVIERAIARVPDPRAVAVAFEHIVENATWCWVRTGQWDRSVELITTSKPFWGERVCHSDVRLGEIELLREGHLQDVDSWWRALDAPPSPGGADRLAIAELLAWHAAEAGDLDELRRLLAGPLAGPEPRGATDALWSIVLLAARAEADAVVRSADPDDRPAAQALLVAVSAVADQLHRFGELGIAWDAELTAQLARFRGEECRRMFVVAVAAWDRIGHVHDAAVARLCLAEAALAEGDRKFARDVAQQALATAKELGARALAGRIEEFLHISRLARPQPSPGDGSGSSGLTPRELEVLSLLAEGRTNEQIAATLFMSPKTASVHVSRIIAKLGASNRTEASAIARRANLL